MGCTTSDQNGQNAQLPSKRYEVREQLGTGEKGQVNRVFDNVKKNQYAEKVIKNIPNDIDLNDRNNEAARCFQKMKGLKHSNLASYDNIFVKDGQAHLFMELSTGGNLKEKIDLKGRISQMLAAKYTKQILQGLAQLHANNLIHNNLKPSNVLFFHKDTLKLSDFCIGDILHQNQVNKSGKFKWTNYPYMAPEVVKQLGVSASSDVWSVGCLVIYMISGSTPWSYLGPEEEVFKQLTNMAVLPHPFGITVACESFLDSCLQIIPSQRSSISDLLSHPFIVGTTPSPVELISLKNSIELKQTAVQTAVQTKEPKKEIPKVPQIKSTKANRERLHTYGGFSQKIVLDDNIIVVGDDEPTQQLSYCQPSRFSMNIESTEVEPDHIVMLNNEKVRLSPGQYRRQMKNYVESTNETQWISPSRIKMKTVKEHRRNYAISENVDDFLRNQTKGASTCFERSEQKNMSHDKGMRIVTEPSEDNKQYFKRPLKLIKKRVMQKKAEARFERTISEYTKKSSVAEQIFKSPDQQDYGELSRINSKSNHEQIVIDTQISRAERNRYKQYQRFAHKKRQEERLKWERQLVKGKELLKEEPIYRYKYINR